MKNVKIFRAVLLVFFLLFTLTSCRLGEILSEADPETEAEVDTIEEKYPDGENRVDVEEDDFSPQ